jgi:DNA polymerase IIIc chi subunit
MINSQLKIDLHQLIDNFEDERVLQIIYEILAGYTNETNQADIIDTLSNQQKNRLNEALLQAQNNQVIAHDIVKQNLEKWLTQ